MQEEKKQENCEWKKEGENDQAGTDSRREAPPAGLFSNKWKRNLLVVAALVAVTAMVSVCRGGDPCAARKADATEQAVCGGTEFGPGEALKNPEYQDFDAHLRLIEEYLFRIAKAQERLSPMTPGQEKAIRDARRKAGDREAALMALMEQLINSSTASADSAVAAELQKHEPLPMP